MIKYIHTDSFNNALDTLHAYCRRQDRNWALICFDECYYVKIGRAVYTLLTISEGDAFRFPANAICNAINFDIDMRRGK